MDHIPLLLKNEIYTKSKNKLTFLRVFPKADNNSGILLANLSGKKHLIKTFNKKFTRRERGAEKCSNKFLEKLTCMQLLSAITGAPEQDDLIFSMIGRFLKEIS
jgi:hypothetical protein